MNISFIYNQKEFMLKLRESGSGSVRVSMGDKDYEVIVERMNHDEFLLKIDGKVYDVIVTTNSNAYDVCLNGKHIHIGKRSAFEALTGKSADVKRREVKTSMPGRIVKLLANPGDRVEEGQAVLILEAMKMQNEIKSPQPGTIASIGPEVGESVEAGSLLFVVE